MSAADKPYFCPQMGTYYQKLKVGVQDCEIRPNNHRSWNTDNIYEGRPILFSYGYGKHDRTLKTVHKTTVTIDLAAAEIPQWHIDAVQEIYPWADEWLIAYV